MRMHAEQRPVNHRSLINQTYMTSDDCSVIGIYKINEGGSQKRFIYLEKGKGDARTLTQFDIAVRDSCVVQDYVGFYKESSPSVSIETQSEISRIRNKSYAYKEIQVTNEVMEQFETKFRDNLEGFQSGVLVFDCDEPIDGALKTIGEDQSFEHNQRRNCTML